MTSHIRVTRHLAPLAANLAWPTAPATHAAAAPPRRAHQRGHTRRAASTLLPTFSRLLQGGEGVRVVEAAAAAPGCAIVAVSGATGACASRHATPVLRPGAPAHTSHTRPRNWHATPRRAASALQSSPTVHVCLRLPFQNIAHRPHCRGTCSGVGKYFAAARPNARCVGGHRCTRRTASR